MRTNVGPRSERWRVDRHRASVLHEAVTGTDDLTHRARRAKS
jgi:hypothetical protein